MPETGSADDMRYWGKTRMDEHPNRRRRKKPTGRLRYPDYARTLAAVRRLVERLLAERSTQWLTKEGISKEYVLDPSLVQRALGELRTAGLVNPPERRAPAGTWRGGGYDDYSAWHPTCWTVRLR